MFHGFQLRELAKQEYEQARGTAHKRLLHAAKNWLEREMRRLILKIDSTRRQKDVISQKYKQALEKALVQIIVHEHLQEVPGIGAQRKAQILQHVFRGHLSDLSRAYQLQGVGPQTQEALNAWAASYTRQLPTLLKENFAGRSAIDQQYQPEIEKAEQQLTKLQQQQKIMQTKAARIDQELKWLDAITQKDFYNALKNPEHPSPTLNLYVQGVFGEWEPMPDWFRDAIEGVEEVQSSPPKTTKSVQEKEPNRLRRWLIGGCVVTSGVALFCVGSTILLMLLTPGQNMEALNTPTAPPNTVVVTALPPTPTATPSPLPTETAVPIMSTTPLPTTTITATAVTLPQVRIIVAAANLRDGPGINFAVIGTLVENDRVELLEQTEDGSWYQVRLVDGSLGWIGSSVGEIEQAAPLESDE